MKKIHKNAAERTAAYRERLKAKQEAAAEQSNQEAVARTWDLRCFGESAYRHNAQTAAEEIHICRQMLRALGEPDILEQETLRQLAKRTWEALLKIDGSGFIPMFNPKTQNFDGGPDYLGYIFRKNGEPDWIESPPEGYFESVWTAPPDCTGDEIIDRDRLPRLPTIEVSSFLSHLAGRVIEPRRTTAHPSFEGK